MKPEKFPYDKFFYLKEEKEKKLRKFISGEEWFVPVNQYPNVDHFGAICKYRDKMLESQLQSKYDYFTLESDFIYHYLEPWHGVGIYASAFGCPIEWHDHNAPETRPIIYNVNDLRNIKYPVIKDCEIFQYVLDTIKYMKEKTGNSMEISLTDTQSPNNTASLIMNTTELFVYSLENPKLIQPFLNMITDVIIEFSQIQKEVIGDIFAAPGHMMYSLNNFEGIALSDDNMSFISPLSYECLSLHHNNKISEYFGGVAIHSCGNFKQNLNELKKIKNLCMLDAKIGYVADPTPIDAKELKNAFVGTNTVVVVRLGHDEVDILKNIIHPKLKLIVSLYTSGDIYEKNKQYEKAKERIKQFEYECKSNT